MKCCTNCGAQAKGNFCSECGEKLNLVNDISELSDWENEINFSNIISISCVRDLISYNCFLFKENASWKPLAKLSDAVFSPLVGFPAFDLAVKMEPFSRLASEFSYWMTGAKIEKSREELIDYSSGKVLVALLCFIACHGQKIHNVNQYKNKCILSSLIPTGIRSYSSPLTVTLTKKGSETHVQAEILTKGQFDDLGRSNQYLNDLVKYLSEMSANLPEIISRFPSTQDLEKSLLNHDTYYRNNACMAGIKRIKNGRRFDLRTELIDQAKANEQGINRLRGEDG